MKTFLVLSALLLSSTTFAKDSPQELKSMPRLVVSETKAVSIEVCIPGSVRMILDSSVEPIATMNQSNLDSFWTSIMDNNRTVFVEVGPKTKQGDETILSMFRSDITKYLVNIKAVKCGAKTDRTKEVVLTK